MNCVGFSETTIIIVTVAVVIVCIVVAVIFFRLVRVALILLTRES